VTSLNLLFPVLPTSTPLSPSKFLQSFLSPQHIPKFQLVLNMSIFYLHVLLFLLITLVRISFNPSYHPFSRIRNCSCPLIIRFGRLFPLPVFPKLNISYRQIPQPVCPLIHLMPQLPLSLLFRLLPYRLP